MSTKSSEAIKFAVTALKEVVGSDGLKIYVKQFDANLFYLPVYEALLEIQKAWNQDCGMRPLKLRFANCGADDETRRAVLNNASSWKENCERKHKHACHKVRHTLTIGLSELPEDEVTNFIGRDFIKRLPLWGVALSNNRKIHILKTKPRENDALAHAARLRYWDAFRGKVSLLRKSDLIDATVRPGVSTYPRGTTARNLLDKFLGEEQMAHVAEVAPSHEFADLFNHQVDIALTVQPWEAINMASELGQDVEIVYVHQGKPQPYSSMYARRCNDTIYDNLLGSLLDIVEFAIQERIGKFYGEDPDSDRVKQVIKVMSEIQKLSGIKVAQTTGGKDGETYACALEMVRDSRIYFYDKRLLKNEFPIQHIQELENNFNKAFSPWYLVTEGKANFPLHFSKVVKQTSALKKHNETPITDLPNVERLVKAIYVHVTDNGACPDFGTANDLKNKWRRDTPFMLFAKDEAGKILNEDVTKLRALTETGPNKWNYENMRYAPWLPEEGTKLALSALAGQFTDKEPQKKCVYIDGDYGLLLNGSNDHALVWFYIEYANHEGQNMFTWDKFKKSRFLSKEHNPAAYKMFNGWWVRGDCELHRIFADSESPPLCPQAKAVLKDKKVMLSYSHTGSEKYIPINRSLNNKNYLLIFAFEIAGYQKT